MNSQLIMRTLKSALKAKGVTYRELGSHLGLSEAAIKKQFQSPDISFNRIIEICQLLGISFEALMTAAQSTPLRELKLTEGQQTYFLKNPEAFVFFLRLSEARGNVALANTDCQWNQQDLWKTLKSLDAIELIRLHPGDRVELIHGSLITVSTEGTPLAQVTHKLAIKFLEKFRQARGSSLHEIKISLLKLSLEDAERLRQDLANLYQVHLRQSEIDSAFLPSEQLHVYSLLMASGEFSFI